MDINLLDGYECVVYIFKHTYGFMQLHVYVQCTYMSHSLQNKILVHLCTYMYMAVVQTSMYCVVIQAVVSKSKGITIHMELNIHACTVYL